MDHSHPQTSQQGKSAIVGEPLERGECLSVDEGLTSGSRPFIYYCDAILAVGKENMEPQLSKKQHLLYFFTPQALYLYRSFRQSMRPSVVES